MKKVIRNLPLLLRSPFTLRLTLLEMLISDKNKVAGNGNVR